MKAIISVRMVLRALGRSSRVACGLAFSLGVLAGSAHGEETAVVSPGADASTAASNAELSTSSLAVPEASATASEAPSEVGTTESSPEAAPSSEPVLAATPPVKRAAPAVKAAAQPGAGSPTLPWIARGDAEFVARDFIAACGSYQSGSDADPKAPLPYLRLIECKRALGQLDEAIQFSDLALRLIQPGDPLQLIALSRQAVLFEAKVDIEKALSVYKVLLSAAASSSSATHRALFEGIARERSAVLEVRRKELADSAIIKARIDEELAEVTPKGS